MHNHPDGYLQVPGWLGLDPAPQAPQYFDGIIGALDGQHSLLSNTNISHSPNRLVAYKTGLGLGGPPSSMPRLKTECIFLRPNSMSFLREPATQFFVVMDGCKAKASKSLRKGYIKAKEGTFGPGSQEVYVHRLICYLYNGPPPADKPMAGHRCENKLCICPWHLWWMSTSENQLRAHAKRKRHQFEEPPSPNILHAD